MREEPDEVEVAGQPVPVTLWLPHVPIQAVVLMGHGLGVDRFHESNRRPAALLVERGCVVLAPELPMHGERRTMRAADPALFVRDWQGYWRRDGIRTLREEWRAIQAHASARFPSLPMGYFGISLGTQYGIVLLAGNAGIRAAVLGLFGSYPPPRTPVMNGHAPLVTCPVAFIKQTDDEIHPAETADHLFDSLGSTEKRLIENTGGHTAVPGETFRRVCDFLTDRLRHSEPTKEDPGGSPDGD